MGKKAERSTGRDAAALKVATATRPVGEGQWRTVLAEQKASGLSVAAFCRREQLNESTLRYWSWRLARDAKQAAPVAPQFLAVPIHAAPSATVVPTSETVEVELGAVRVRLAGAYAARVTEAVLARLETAR